MNTAGIVCIVCVMRTVYMHVLFVRCILNLLCRMCDLVNSRVLNVLRLFCVLRILCELCASSILWQLLIP